MIRKLAYRGALLLALTGLYACNSDSINYGGEDVASAAAVRSFSLSKDDKVMANLDSVFFSIDLANATIFNADSLPAGTKVSALVPQITTLDAVSLIQISFSRAGKSDTTITYTASETDSVDFTNPVSLRIVSADGLTDRTYRVKVNVHEMIADTLFWDTKDSFPLPSSLAAPAAQRSAATASRLYTLSQAANSYSLAYYDGIDNLGSAFLDKMPLVKKTVSFGFTPVIESFAATPDGAIYILDTDGHLHRSPDGGTSWTVTGTVWHSIIGAYGNQILGIARSASGDYTVRSTSGASMPLPAGMPVSGFSMPVTYTFSMSANPQLMIAGGRRADGKLSAEVWGFDGKTWMAVSKKNLPVALENATLIPYYAFDAVSGVTSRRESAMLVIGGRKADGTLNTDTYISTDYGYIWSKASSDLQLPSYMPAMQSAQAFVLSTTLHIAPVAKAPARISRPVESWQCPYIYLFGGCDEHGTLYPTVWRGVINRLSFKPIV